MKKVVIATTTMYQDVNDLRFKLALRTVQEAKRQGYPIVVVDESPDARIRQILQEKEAIVLLGDRKGMGPSRRKAFHEAAKIVGSDGIIVWMEPEKYTFISSLGMIARYMEDQLVDLVIPERKSLESYPSYQQHSETIGRIAFSLLTGKDLDLWFGPRVFRTDIAHFFLDYKGEYGDKWDSIFVPVLRIIKAEKKVCRVPVDYTHPPEQTKAEEDDFSMFKKRLEQLIDLIEVIKMESQVLGLTP